jgi:hypothetical protein
VDRYSFDVGLFHSFLRTGLSRRFPTHFLGQSRGEQIERAEELSDAYHLQLGDVDVVVAYLLEITRKGMEGTR